MNKLLNFLRNNISTKITNKVKDFFGPDKISELHPPQMTDRNESSLIRQNGSVSLNPKSLSPKVDYRANRKFYADIAEMHQQARRFPYMMTSVLGSLNPDTRRSGKAFTNKLMAFKPLDGSSARDLANDFDNKGESLFRGVQIFGEQIRGTSPGERINLLTIHGSPTGEMATSVFNPFKVLTDKDVSDLSNSVEDLYVATCYPNQVGQRYRFLRMADPESKTKSMVEFYSKYHGGFGEDAGSEYQWLVTGHDELSPAVYERKEALARHSPTVLDVPSRIDLTMQSRGPIYMGPNPAEKLDLLRSENKSDKYLEKVHEDFKKATRTGGLFTEAGGFKSVRVGDLVPNATNFYEHVFGKAEDIVPIIDIIRKHATAKTQNTTEYRREVAKALGFSDEGIDLLEFTNSPAVKDALGSTHADGEYPITEFVEKEIRSSPTIDQALISGLKPRDIQENIAKNIETFIGDLPTDLIPGGKSLRTVETAIEKITKEINIGRTIAPIAGLAAALGIGIGFPSIASASTGTSPVDGGLGSTLAIGAGAVGVATVAGVGAYSYSKIRKAGLNPRVAGGAAGGGAAGAAGAAAGAVNRNRGSWIYNSGFVQEELDLTTRGFFAGIGSVINDFGFNRRTGSFDTSGKPDSFIDSLFGKALKQDGYVHPVFRAEEATWRVASNLDDAYKGWKDFVKTSYDNSSGITKLFQGVRYHGFKILDSVGDGWLNKQLVKAGGFSTIIAPALMAHGALGDFKEGYRRGGLIGGAFKTVTGLISGLVQNKVIAGILLNPATGLLGAGITAAAGYTAFKIFDVRNKGAEYIRSGRMGGLSWNRGPTPGMSGSMAATARQRGLNAMNNSRFNAMKAMGNESYMMNAPKSRYANSTAIHGITPVLSY